MERETQWLPLTASLSLVSSEPSDSFLLDCFLLCGLLEYTLYMLCMNISLGTMYVLYVCEFQLLVETVSYQSSVLRLLAFLTSLSLFIPSLSHTCTQYTHKLTLYLPHTLTPH